MNRITSGVLFCLGLPSANWSVGQEPPPLVRVELASSEGEDDLTKLAVHYDHGCRWSSDASLRVYWGFPGDDDLTNYDNAYAAVQANAGPVSDPGFFDAFKEAIFLNYALNYRHCDHVTARLDLYNILGWFDRDVNKRNFIFQPTTYRSEAAAVAATVRVTY